MKKLKQVLLICMPGIVALALSGCGSATIDLNKYVTIEAEGYNIFSGGVDGQGFVYTLIMLAIRVLLSVFAGIFIAPWMIAKKLVSLIPGGEAQV